MARLIIKYIFSFTGILLISININGQNSHVANKINFGIKGGTSILLAEIPKEFSQIINEFDNKFGFTIDAELSKYFSNHWEVAIDFNYTIYRCF